MQRQLEQPERYTLEEAEQMLARLESQIIQMEYEYGDHPMVEMLRAQAYMLRQSLEEMKGNR